ncbi:type II toxin-antitoxin system RatA family toxin [Futiania mangrovi]|uniref:Type II toxin-antitoxin system RatA family toxin n=1 Tax=Futiania mangrovi TaxID=2959716 RepID=A0A9J6PI73_9PROT|nr:type II toxin-antitoxin system RatA family toxin [Futiania mangrovii]MCP1335786.1 type II toxin-antitoxin system RatA family toxin [Futiania mangrovii]
MPTHAEKRHVPWRADQMYDLVAAVDRYPEFLPWCSGARIRRRELADGHETLIADLIISFKVFREKFTSRVTLRPEETRVDVDYVDGPFRYLANHWHFIPREDGGCDIDFYVDFEFRSAILQRVVTALFQEAMQRLVRAFEARARDLYGPGEEAAQA